MMVLAITATCALKKVVAEKYEKDGLSFTHFSNWVIKEDKLLAEGKARLITIEGPENAVLTLSRFSAANLISLESYARTLANQRKEALKKQLGGVVPLSEEASETGPATMNIAGENRVGLSQKFNIRLLGIDVPHVANFFMVEHGGYQWILMIQAPAEKWNRVESGCQKILDTLAFSGGAEEH